MHCPPGLTCENGYCVAPGTAPDCSPSYGAGGALEGGPVTNAGSVTSGGSGAMSSFGGSSEPSIPGAASGGAASREGAGLEGGIGGSVAGAIAGEAGAGGTAEVTTVPLVISAPLTSKWCVGRTSAIALVAHGGTAPYSWRLEGTVPGLALNATDQREVELGGNPSARGDYTIVAHVNDGRGVPASERLALEVEGDCPVVDLEALPHPCALQPYRQTVRVSGGAAPFRWEAVTLPPELTFDGNTRVLSGFMREPGRVTLAVTDRLDRRFENSYELVPREKCWLAYVADAGVSGRLELVDPLLSGGFGIPSSAGVRDFEFSPDGRFLVYLGQRDGELPRLTLVRLADFAELALDFDGVTHFSWSPDSANLAVIARGMLGGIRLSEAAWDVRAELEIDGITVFDPVALTFAPSDGPLPWSGNAVVAFAAPLPGAQSRFVFTSELGSEGFTLPELREGAFRAGLVLHPAERGIFAIDPDQAVLGFYAIGESTELVWHGHDLVAPNGRFTARLSEQGRLQVFLAEMPSRGAALPLIESDECAKIRAWSNDGARLACATADQRVVTYTVAGADTEAPSMLRRKVEGNYREAADEDGARRTFSPSGRFFAFAGKERLSVADLVTQRLIYSEEMPVLPGDSDPGASQRLELAFSANERLLLAHRGAHLWLHRPLVSAPPEWVGDALLASAPECHEDYLRAPAAYCGAAQNPRDFAWSSWSDAAEAQIAAMKTAEGKLVLLVRRRAGEAGADARAAIEDGCVGAVACVGKFRFQP